MAKVVGAEQVVILPEQRVTQNIPLARIFHHRREGSARGQSTIYAPTFILVFR